MISTAGVTPQLSEETVPKTFPPTRHLHVARTFSSLRSPSTSTSLPMHFRSVSWSARLLGNQRINWETATRTELGIERNSMIVGTYDHERKSAPMRSS
jgi:hypothetical protein